MTTGIHLVDVRGGIGVVQSEVNIIYIPTRSHDVDTRLMPIAERYLEVSSDRHKTQTRSLLKTANTGDVWKQRIVKQCVNSYVSLASLARLETFA